MCASGEVTGGRCDEHAEWMDVEFLDPPRSEDSDRSDPCRPHPVRLLAPRHVVAVITTLLGMTAIIVVERGQDATPPSSRGQTAPSSAQESIDHIAMIAGSRMDSAVIVTGVGGVPCNAVPVDAAPQQQAVAALRSVLPGYRSLDYSRTLDQSGGMCSLLVRARDSDGTVIVLETVAPGASAVSATQRLETRSGNTDTVTSEYAHFTNASGWSVIAGASGRAAGLPRPAMLATVARDPRLRW